MSETQREPWQRMLEYIHQLVRAETWCRDPDTPVGVSVHSRAIWLHRGYGEHKVEARLEAEGWWEPLTKRQGRQIAERLLGELRERLGEMEE